MNKSACSSTSSGYPCSPWAVALILTALVIACVSSAPSSTAFAGNPVPLLDAELPAEREVIESSAIVDEPFSFCEEDEGERDFVMLRGESGAAHCRCRSPFGSESFNLQGAALRYAPKQGPPHLSREFRQHPEASVRT